MKVLTLWPEWCFAVLHLGKCVENRSWKPPEDMIGTRFALHAGKYIGGRPGPSAVSAGMEGMGFMAASAGWCAMHDDEGGCARFLRFPALDLPVEVYLDDPAKLGCKLPSSTTAIVKSALVGTVVLDKVLKGDSPPWGVEGMYHWHLRDLRVFPEPIPAAGSQRLWNLSKEQDVEVALQMGSPLRQCD